MSSAAIMEALARIEHKVDLALHLSVVALTALDPKFKVELKTVGNPAHNCPICRQTPEYQIDISNAVVLRKCGCSTGKIPIDLKAFAPLELPTKKKDEDNGRADQEDGSDSDRRRGPRSR